MKGTTLAITKLSVAIILIIISLSGNYGVVTGLTPAECHEQINVLVGACRPVIYRVPPSAYCCQRIRVTDIHCVCNRITPKLAPLVNDNIDYGIAVVHRCGRQVPRHYKCGSITTP
ncbi:hypothetical protein vseg_009466 [Gypsophila vaccaria]